MRPPNKSRSRNKNNRRGGGGGANLGNALNRVYESAGPDGKVRGTPVQVIEKYQALAHDSALAGDRVATENFQQHAEHYIRLINDVQRQLAEQREQQQQNQQNQQNTQNNQGQNGQGRSQHNNGNGAQPNVGEQPKAQPDVNEPGAPAEETLSVLGGDMGDGEQPSGLVETPEATPKPAKAKDGPVKAKAPKDADGGDQPKRRRSRSRKNAESDGGPETAPEPPAE